MAAYVAKGKSKGREKRVFTGGIKPDVEKKPRFQDPLIEGSPLAWRFSACDRGGPYSWATLQNPQYKAILEKLHEYETKNYNDIMKAGSHTIEISELCKDAQDRLSQIKMDDIEALMSFRCEGDDRVWCVPEGSLMRVLWYDPKHQVYPVAKDKADRHKHSGKAA